MATPTHLKSLQALEMALRLGSLKSAADALAITPAAVGQRVKALERYLGCELLVRGRAGVRLPENLSGAALPLSAAFRALETAVEQLDMQRSHDIQVAAEPDFADLWLLPRLTAFRRSHPNVRFCINGEGDAPLRLGPSDCEITFGPWHAEARTDLLFRDYLAPICSPDTWRRIAKIKTRSRLEGYPLLHLDFFKNDPEAPSWPEWIAKTRVERSAPDRGIRFQRIARVLDAVLADAGVTIAGLALLANRIEEGTLVLPYPVEFGSPSSHGFKARFRVEALARPPVRRFRRWLESEAQRTTAWLEGCISKRAQGPERKAVPRSAAPRSRPAGKAARRDRVTRRPR